MDPRLRAQSELDDYIETARSRAPTSEAPPDVAGAADFILDNLFDEELNVDYVLENMQISSKSFSGKFFFYTGEHPREFIETRRLRAAVRLRERLDVPGYFAAYAVGYASYRTFARAFKRVLGCSPCSDPLEMAV